MESLVLTGLLVGVALLFLLVLVVFGRAFFWGEHDLAQQAGSEATWRPPFLRGRELREWAAQATENTVREHLRQGPEKASLARMTQAVASGAVQAMLPQARQRELEQVVPCPAEGQGIIGVTPPEALAIAAQIRKCQSRSEQEQIHDLAVANEWKLHSWPGCEGGLAPLACPLQGSDRVCCVYSMRPLQCRPLLARAIARHGNDPAASAGHNAPHDSGENGNDHERTVGEGIEMGLSRGLRSARLDGNLYELNSALGVCLATPDAAARWAAGEDIFAGCTRLPLPEERP